VGILLIVGCAEEPPSPAPPAPPVTPTTYSVLWVTIPIEVFSTTPHTNEIMHAAIGEKLTVTIGSNPTTGYQWSEFAEISDETIIRQVDHKFVEPETDAPGTPGEEVWTFEALKEGSVTTFLDYSRSWNETDALHWTVTITTIVRQRN